MPPTAEPATEMDRFLQAIVRSGLHDANTVQRWLLTAPPALRKYPITFADWLVTAGALTRFQADKLLQGAFNGLLLGPFCILAPLGRGAMGIVYLVRDRRNDRLMALKILSPKKAKAQAHLVARFRREMDVCQRVAHPHITQTYEVGSLQGVHYIAMEYIAGRSLYQVVKQSGPLNVPRTAQVFMEVCAALGYAHGEGLIHRDLKPSNLMLTFEGRAKVLDFGLAIMMDEEPPTDKTIAGGQGYVVGTMDYLAPEQAEDPLGVDPRCDLYSLGCTLFFTLTGQPPFPGGSTLKKIMKHRTQAAPFVTDLNPTVPTAFAQLVERLMAKQPVNRPASANEVLRLLHPWAAAAPEPLNELGPDDTPTIINLDAPLVAAAGVWDNVSVMPFVAPEGTEAPRIAAASGPRKPGSGWLNDHLMWILSVVFLLGGALLLAIAVVWVRQR